MNSDFERPLPVIDRSKALLHRAEGLIPGYTQTMAKGPSQHVRGVAPHYLQRGKGCRVWDVDGNEFLDYTMAVGPLVLGYCNPDVDNAIAEQLKDGITFSLMHPLEVEVAELIRSIVPNAEMVRYSKTGADVTSAAVRLARAYSGRNTVVCCGYHGWHDWYIGVTDRVRGIPEPVRDLTYTFAYNSIESVYDSVDDDTAAIILEPTVFEAPSGAFLHELREFCTQRGIILIFDEMWTGFRLALGGAQQFYGVDADLICFSKAIANGMPLSVLTGKAEIMRLCEDDVFFYTTFGGEALSLAAAKATIGVLRDHDVTTQLHDRGQRLRDGYNDLAAELGMSYTSAVGYGVRTMVAFHPAAGDPLLMKSFVQQELIRRGILWNGFHTMSYAHQISDIEETIAAYQEILPALKTAVSTDRLRESILGEPMKPVFRRVGNFNTRPRHHAST